MTLHIQSFIGACIVILISISYSIAVIEITKVWTISNNSKISFIFLCNGLLIFLGEKFTNRAAKQLTKLQNYKTLEKFESSLILKMVLFHYFKCIIPSLYLAWVLYYNQLGISFSNKDTWFSRDIILQGNVILSIIAKLLSDIKLYYLIPLNSLQRHEKKQLSNELDYIPC
jgi:hypothetical protein